MTARHRHDVTMLRAPLVGIGLGLLACTGSAGETSPQSGTTDLDTSSSSGTDDFECSGVPTPGSSCAPFGVVSAGMNHTCVILEGGRVRCWGFNAWGQLGYGLLDNVGDDEAPNSLTALKFDEPVVQVAPGGVHTCALLERGGVRCWGDGRFGRLGNGSIESIGDDELATEGTPVELPAPVLQLALGYSSSCALSVEGRVYCWGSADSGMLGHGNSEDIGDDESLEALSPVELGGEVVSIAATYRHACAILEGGSVRCWGDGEHGSLGNGDTQPIGDDELPSSTPPVNFGGTAVQVAVGFGHTCVRTAAAEVRCWGANAEGQLGYGHTEDIGDDEDPIVAGAVELGGKAVHIGASATSTCALLESGALRCWGGNRHGQLGLGDRNPVGDDELPIEPQALPFSDVAQIAVGGSHVCALEGGGTLLCWGSAVAGRLGAGGIAPETCQVEGSGSTCDKSPICCVGDQPGELPPPSAQYD